MTDFDDDLEVGMAAGLDPATALALADKRPSRGPSKRTRQVLGLFDSRPAGVGLLALTLVSGPLDDNRARGNEPAHVIAPLLFDQLLDCAGSCLRMVLRPQLESTVPYGFIVLGRHADRQLRDLVRDPAAQSIRERISLGFGLVLGAVFDVQARDLTIDSIHDVSSGSILH